MSFHFTLRLAILGRVAWFLEIRKDMAADFTDDAGDVYQDEIGRQGEDITGHWRQRRLAQSTCCLSYCREMIQ
jgi:hypothetical protein